MKTKCVTVILGIAGLVAEVQAQPISIDCQAKEGASFLQVRPVKENGLDAYVTFDSDGNSTTFGAVQKVQADDKGLMYKKQEYDLFAYPKQFAKMVVMTRKIFGRGGCGRGGCENGTVISVQLLHGGQKIEFSCQEVEN